VVWIPSWSASSFMLCHAPSLMTVKNLSMLKCNRDLLWAWWYFNLKERVVGSALIVSSVFFDSIFID
jgi:hypothetical protein